MQSCFIVLQLWGCRELTIKDKYFNLFRQIPINKTKCIHIVSNIEVLKKKCPSFAIMFVPNFWSVVTVQQQCKQISIPAALMQSFLAKIIGGTVYHSHHSAVFCLEKFTYCVTTNISSLTQARAPSSKFSRAHIFFLETRSFYLQSKDLARLSQLQMTKLFQISTLCNRDLVSFSGLHRSVIISFFIQLLQRAVLYYVMVPSCGQHVSQYL